MNDNPWVAAADNLALTISVSLGSTVDEVLAAYRGHREDLAMMTFAEACVPISQIGTWFWIQLIEQPHSVIVLENAGWAGTSQQIARVLSARGRRFLSVYWSVNANYHLTDSRNGHIAASFDPAHLPSRADDHDLYPEWLTEEDFDPDQDVRAWCLTVLEHQTGVRFDQTWLTIPLPSCRIPHPDDPQSQPFPADREIEKAENDYINFADAVRTWIRRQNTDNHNGQ